MQETKWVQLLDFFFPQVIWLCANVKIPSVHIYARYA